MSSVVRIPGFAGATVLRHTPHDSGLTASGAAGRRFLDPKDPLATARWMIEDMFSLNGQRTLHRHRDNFYAFDNSSYRALDDDWLRKAIYEYLESACVAGQDSAKFKANKRRVEDVLDAIRAICLIDSTIDPPVWLDERSGIAANEMLPVANGLLHLPGRRLHAPTPAYFGLHGTSITFDPNAPEPAEWLGFLDTTFADAASIRLLQQWFGYCLTADTAQQKIMLIVGQKRSGKGTLAAVITAMVGRNNVVNPTAASLAQNFGAEALIGKTLAVFGDARIGGRTDTAAIAERLLGISGEDGQTIDRKFRQPWTGRLPARFMMFSNELPKLNDASGALASRFLILETKGSFLGQEDFGLKDRLLLEMPGILNWTLHGLADLRREKRFTVPESTAKIMQDMEHLSSPMKAFIDEECVVHGEILPDTLYAHWMLWCNDNNLHPGSKATFGKNLRAAVPNLGRSQTRSGDIRGHLYTGISLKKAVG